MQITPYLSFSGNCDAALKFYEKALGGKITMKMIFGESPMAKDMPPEVHNQIMHSRIEIDGKVIMCSDSPCRYSKPQGFHLTLSIDKPEEADRLFAVLSENGTITMPIEETFWAHRFGMLVDQFGTPWMINCEKMD
jgi:PhnB protein